MSNSRRFGRRRDRTLSPEGRQPPAAYTSTQLHQFLVTDAVAQHATDLRWFVLAVRRIAELDRISIENATCRVINEVVALTGHGLPVYSGPINAG